jgi:hypothetical protein
MSGPAQRPYDCRDAVAYLHEYILSNSKKPVESQEIMEWGRKYDKVVTIDALRQINNMYKQSVSLNRSTYHSFSSSSPPTPNARSSQIGFRATDAGYPRRSGATKSEHVISM